MPTCAGSTAAGVDALELTVADEHTSERDGAEATCVEILGVTQ